MPDPDTVVRPAHGQDCPAHDASVSADDCTCHAKVALSPLDAPAAASDAETARKAYWSVMHTWNNRNDTLAAKLGEAWHHVAEVIEADARAAERERIRQLAVKHKATYPHYAEPGFIDRHPPFADLLDGGTDAPIG